MDSQPHRCEDDAAVPTDNEELASRYATALMQLAEEQKAVDAVADDLKKLKTAIAGSPELGSLIRSPLMPRRAGAAAMVEALTAAGANALTVRFVGMVAQNRRLPALTGIADRFLADLAARRGEVTAQVTSAQPLSDAQMQDIAAALKGKLGAKVTLDAKVDPAILGGLIVKVGSRMMDNSVRTKLLRLEAAMTAAA